MDWKQRIHCDVIAVLCCACGFCCCLIALPGDSSTGPKYSAALGARRLWLALSGQELKPQRAQLCFASFRFILILFPLTSCKTCKTEVPALHNQPGELLNSFLQKHDMLDHPSPKAMPGMWQSVASFGAAFIAMRAYGRVTRWLNLSTTCAPKHQFLGPQFSTVFGPHIFAPIDDPTMDHHYREPFLAIIGHH